MRIGIDYRMGGSVHAGIGRYVSQLLFHLLSQGMHSYWVFYRPESILEEELQKLKNEKEVNLIPISARHYSLAEQTVFIRALYKQNLDLVHFPNFNAPILYKKPFVVTIHDMVHHKISGHKKSRFLHFLAYKKVMLAAGRNSKKIITVSESAKSDIINILRQPSEKIEVIYEGASLVPESEERIQKIKTKYLLSRPYFLFVGTLERKKNVVTLARAFDLFLENYKLEMDLVLAGKPDHHYPEVKYKAMDIKHKNRLIFTGYVDDKDLSALYQGAYAFVSASVHEGFGLPGVEAMHFGLPLIVSNTEVFNEIYSDAAIYFDPGNLEDIADKMRLLATDSQFYAQVQQKSARRSRHFDWQTTASRTLQVYENALPKPDIDELEPEI